MIDDDSDHDHNHDDGVGGFCRDGTGISRIVVMMHLLVKNAVTHDSNDAENSAAVFDEESVQLRCGCQ